MPPAYLIDASIYIFKSYFSLPDNWHSEEGYPCQALYGYLLFLFRLLEEAAPGNIAAAFDESLGSCFRNQIHPEYKANRALPDEALAFQLAACREATDILGIASFASDTYEADDIIGTLAARGRQSGQQIVIISRDKDLGQLLKHRDLLWDFGNLEPRDRNAIYTQYGVWPEQLADYLALVGDAVDSIPGVPGIGPKTASVLLSRHNNLDEILAAGNELVEVPVRGAAKLPGKIASHRQQLMMARQLTGIPENVPLADRCLKRKSIQLDRLANFCQRMGLGDGIIGRAERLNVTWHLDQTQAG